MCVLLSFIYCDENGLKPQGLKRAKALFFCCVFSLKAEPQLFSPSCLIARLAKVYVNVSLHHLPTWLPLNLQWVRWLLGLQGSPLEGQCETLTRVDTCPSVPGKNMVRRV